MFAKSVLVTGANRGLGLELVKQLANQTENVFAGCRSSSQAEELAKVAENHENVTVIELDVTSQVSIDAARMNISGVIGEHGLNCLINNAGISDKSEQLLENVTAESLQHLYDVNVIGPAMVTKTFLSMLRTASSHQSGNNMRVSRAAVWNMSTGLASIGENDTARLYGYRMSKAALNMLTKNLSIELQPEHVLVFSLHPGWVQTDMGGPNAELSKSHSIQSMIDTVSKFTEENNGLFYNWEGNSIPW